MHRTHSLKISSSIKFSILGVFALVFLCLSPNTSSARVRWGRFVSALPEFFPRPPNNPKRPWVKDQMPAQLLQKTPQGKYVVSGVRWGYQRQTKPRFTEASINPRKVENVYLVVQHKPGENFGGHAMLAFRMAGDAHVASKDGQNAPGFFLSQEARMKKGQRYDYVSGVLGQYAEVLQLSTWGDRVYKSCKLDKCDIDFYPIKLKPEQMQQLAKSTLERSTHPKRRLYNTLFANCSIVDVELINGVLPRKQRVNRFDPRIIVPMWVPRLLANKKLIDINHKFTLTQEMTDHGISFPPKQPAALPAPQMLPSRIVAQPVR